MGDAIDEIKARWVAATPGPWHHTPRSGHPARLVVLAPSAADIAAIAAAPSDVATLLAEIDRLRKVEEAARAIERATRNGATWRHELARLRAALEANR